jgi:tRNA/tmRNA/rRNA uracil-C5-methylase (TrmA/RlmC/RlmD family)
VADLLGEILELDVGGAAHGGACVARHEGRVVFVRHALPGERVRARVTEDRGGGFCRADAIEVLVAAPGRVPPPCPFAGPGRCGGCDWQHASAAEQHALKAAVIREQFARVAHRDVDDVFDGVEALPGGLLGWRSRVTYAVDAAGRPGLHRHRSAELEHVDHCPLGVAGVGDAEALRHSWPELLAIEAARGDAPDVALVTHRPGRGRQSRGRRPPDRLVLLSGPQRLRYQVGTRTFDVSTGSFWQVHPGAAQALVSALLDGVAPRSGERVLDLYAGVGAFTAALAGAVGPDGAVTGVESSSGAVRDAADNLADLPWAEVRQGRVTAPGLGAVTPRPDLVVLDPPRAGAGTAVMRAILALAPRTVGYVSCEPGTLARDVGVALEAGWRLTRLRAFDAFPMTQHVECLATLQRPQDLTSP